MTNLIRARTLAGNEFSAIPDDELSFCLAYDEKLMKREFRISEAKYFKNSLRAHLSFIAKKAGAIQSKFVPEMYGSEIMVNTQDAPQGGEGE